MNSLQDAGSPGRILRYILPTTADAVFAGILCIVVFFNMRPLFFYDGDPGWHIRAGEHMLTTRSVPRHDLFSYTMAGEPWVTYEWGAEVLIALAHRFAGLHGPALMAALLMAMCYTLIYVFVRREGFPFLFSFVFLAFVLAGSSFHWVPRPHVLTYPVLILAGVMFDRIRSGRIDRRWLWVSPAVIVLWVNLHPSFLAGLVILASGALADVLLWLRVDDGELAAKRARDGLLVLAASCLATLANPNGWELHRYLARYFHAVHALNPPNELHSPSFQYSIFQPFLIAVIALLPALAFGRYRPRLDEVIMLGVWCGLGFVSLRNIPVMFFICFLSLARVYASLIAAASDAAGRLTALLAPLTALAARVERTVSIECRLRGHMLAVSAMLLCAYVAANEGMIGGQRVMGAGFAPSVFPLDAAPYLDSHMPSGRVFNEWILGGWLIYNYHPRVQVFVDGRLDFYGEEHTRLYLDTLNTPHMIGEKKERWTDVFSRFDIRWAMIPPDRALAAAIEREQGWERVYGDDRYVIFAKTE